MSKFAWGYGQENGPLFWGYHFPQACGKNQSPVNIDTKATVHRFSLISNPLRFNYWEKDVEKLTNNGHSLQCDLSADATSTVTNGPLCDPHILKQFHFHWGDSSNHGSEHTVDGKSYAAELHLVHRNGKYGTFEESLNHSDGLCVVTCFIQSGSCTNMEFSKLITNINNVKYPNESINVQNLNINPRNLLPGNTTEYWTYMGSLTTPPCLEVVRFIIFKQPIIIGEHQLSQLRLLKTDPSTRENNGCHGNQNYLVNNFRPPLPLYDRKIFSSF